MYPFIQIFWLLLVLNFTSASEDDIAEVRKLLIKNNTKKWLDSMQVRSSDSPYCKLCCVNITANTIGKTCGIHTLCKYPANSIGASCKGYINVKFTNEELSAILELHNALRSKVANGLEPRGSKGPQPPASNMRMMVWSKELAEIAERWGAQCIFSHDRCRDTASFPVGQNLARGSLATNNELSLVIYWYDEVAMFDKEEVNDFVMPLAGDHLAEHYTQIIWADTYQLGCARAVFQHYEDGAIAYKEHLICNYGPSGNIPSQPVYKIGKPCSFCPEGTNCAVDFSGLCELEKQSGLSGRLLVRSESNVERKSIILLFIQFLNVYLCLYLFR